MRRNGYIKCCKIENILIVFSIIWELGVIFRNFIRGKVQRFSIRHHFSCVEKFFFNFYHANPVEAEFLTFFDTTDQCATISRALGHRLCYERFRRFVRGTSLMQLLWCMGLLPLGHQLVERRHFQAVMGPGSFGTWEIILFDKVLKTVSKRNS